MSSIPTTVQTVPGPISSDHSHHGCALTTDASDASDGLRTCCDVSYKAQPITENDAVLGENSVKAAMEPSRTSHRETLLYGRVDDFAVFAVNMSVDVTHSETVSQEAKIR